MKEKEQKAYPVARPRSLDTRTDTSEFRERVSRLSPNKLRLLALELGSQIAVFGRAAREPIAIIGMACRFPGADNPDAFWALLRDGVDVITDVPADRWSADDFYSADPDAPGKTYSRSGGFLSEIDRFDADFFGISPREATAMDPQQRLFLEVAWEALEDAGLTPDQLAHTRTGVFAGIGPTEYPRIHLAEKQSVDAYTATGNAHSLVANRLSYLLDLHGPSLSVDTACSSSLVAADLACRSLRNRESQVAFAGAVFLLLSPLLTISLSKARMLARDGRCKTFDARADGYVRGEGCGVVVLKRLSDALVDGDRILALIRGSAVNQDGRSNGLTAPSVLGQQEVLRGALENAGLDPSDISYIEAHGTGTPLGDPIEFDALKAVYGVPRGGGVTCAVGSVKTNIGHTEPVAGMAGLIKTILAFQHEVIPPHLHLENLNPNISLEATPFVIPTKLHPWPSGEQRRFAAVSSFGLGGTTAHMLLEEAPDKDAVLAQTERPLHVLTLAAKREEALQELARLFAKYLGAHPEVAFTDICYTANAGRAKFSHRLALVAGTSEVMREQLAAAAAGSESPGVMKAQVKGATAPKVAWLFTGQGSQYVGMGRQLYDTQPTFRNTLDRCDELLRPDLEKTLLSVLYPESGETSLLDETGYTQPALFALEYSLAELWRSWGIEPAAVMGHSVGEYVAACVAGVFSLEDGLKLIAERSRLMQALPREGMMAAVFSSLEDLGPVLEQQSKQISVAAINGPREIVLSGSYEPLQAVLKGLKARGIEARSLNVSHAFHSHLMEPILESFERVASKLSFGAPTIDLISNLTGEVVQAGQICDADYWRRHVREPVRFAEGMQTLRERGCQVLLEVGPQATLLGMGKKCWPHSSGTWLPSLRKGRDDWQQLLSSLQALYVRGVEVDWSGFDRDYRRRKVALPTYPFQRQRYWLETKSAIAAIPGDAPSAAHRKAVHPLLGIQLQSPLPEIQFQSCLSTVSHPFFADHRIYGTAVFPATAYMEMALAGALEALGAGPYGLRDVFVQAPLVLSDDQVQTLQLVLKPDGAEGATFQFFSLRNDEGQQVGTWKFHAGGKINRASSGAKSVSIESLQVRCVEEVSVAAFYKRLRETGAEYGPAFRGIERLWCGEGESLGLIGMPDVLSEADGYLLHPALLDACLQVCAAILFNGQQPRTTEAAYIPIGLEGLRFTGPSTSRLWGHARLQSHADTAQGTVKADFSLVDREGRSVAELTGLLLKRVARNELSLAGEEPFSDWLYELQWRPRPRQSVQESDSGAGPGKWLIFADPCGIGGRLAALMRERGESCVVVLPGDEYGVTSDETWSANPRHTKDFERLLHDSFATSDSYLGIVHLWGLDGTFDEEMSVSSLKQSAALGCGSVLHLLQAVTKASWSRSPRLWLVTKGAQAVGPQPGVTALGQATLWGLGRVISLEHPQLECVIIDLDPAAVEQAANVLLEEILTPDEEDQVAHRGGQRHVARLARRRSRTQMGAEQLPLSEGRPYSLAIPTRGVLENLVLQPAVRRAPGPGEVEIRVHATGLNFRDVLNALGLYPGDAGQLGLECAGEVVALGEGVEGLELGEAVVGLAPGSFSSFATSSAAHVVSKPQSLSFEEAATIPVAFLTAYYGLQKVAKMSRGERVLIHAAAGGVGMAAVQLAHRCGAEVVATASTGKRAALESLGVKHVLNSRSLDFSEQVMQLTSGRGVDVILNSLAEEFIPKSLSALTVHGRFVEIGKRGIWERERVAEFRSDVSYFVVDLAELSLRDSALIQSMLRELMEGFRDGTLKPLPHRAFPITETASAFRYMAQAKHTGKIVVSPQAGVAGAPPGVHEIRPETSYLVTGGLGALGLQVAQWMVGQGARHIVLMGRRAPSATAREVLRKLEDAGAEIVVVEGDVSREEDVARVVKALDTLPPLRGVIHAAGVLDDGVLGQQEWSRFAKVFSAKVEGSWNLHTSTKAMPLDFFVFFSSSASLLGSLGQGNYAAANAFMDALAHQRRAQGLPALSINWGPWAEGGMAATVSDGVQRRWASQGVGVIEPEQGLRVLQHLLPLEGAPPQAGVFAIQWDKFLGAFPADQPPGLLSEFATEVKRKSEVAQAGHSDILRRLGQAREGERRNVLIGYLRVEVERVLSLDGGMRIEPEERLFDLGLDSLMAVELQNRLQTSLKCTLPSTLFFEYPTLASVAEYLILESLSQTSPEEIQPESLKTGQELDEILTEGTRE
jgi:acyl transferase domain-containing protein/acyl carrier protein